MRLNGPAGGTGLGDSCAAFPDTFSKNEWPEKIRHADCRLQQAEGVTDIFITTKENKQVNFSEIVR